MCVQFKCFTFLYDLVLKTSLIHDVSCCQVHWSNVWKQRGSSGCGVCGKLRFWSKIKLGKTLLIKTGRFRQPLALLVHCCLAASAISLHFSQNHIHFCPNYTNFCHKFDFPPHIAPVVPENRSACGRGQYSSLKCKLLSMTVVNFSYICKTLK